MKDEEAESDEEAPPILSFSETMTMPGVKKGKTTLITERERR